MPEDSPALPPSEPSGTPVEPAPVAAFEESTTLSSGPITDSEHEASIRRGLLSTERALRDVGSAVSLMRTDLGMTQMHVAALEQYLRERDGAEFELHPPEAKPRWKSVRVIEGTTFRNRATLVVVLTRELMHMLAVVAHDRLVYPPNAVRSKEFVNKEEVGYGRNEVVDRFLNHPAYKEFEFLLFWDDDVLPPADGWIRLMRWVDSYAVVGGLYHLKGEPSTPLMFKRGPAESGAMAASMPMLPIVDWQHEEAVEVDGMGMGFTIIKREALEKIEPPWFKTRAEVHPDGGQLTGTEDLYFLEKLRKADPKARFLVDTSCRCTHLDTRTRMQW